MTSQATYAIGWQTDTATDGSIDGVTWNGELMNMDSLDRCFIDTPKP